METTFITIHDLTPDARILYSSDSIVDILGYTPDEVLHRSCWDFFHPNELPIAQDLHSRGVKLDKAAVLSYCQLRNRQAQWICCECCFTIVYDVMVVCTSIYRRGTPSQSRAAQAPVVRRLFSSSPKDPRYHMLSHLSGKFGQTKQEQNHEPRAALFLNRFTRTLTIMYATAGIEKILGISGENMKGKSFYYCIQENCLDEAVRCLESAKGNDSIAYLRFWFRDPRVDDLPTQDDTETGTETETDVSMTDVTSDQSEDEWEENSDRQSPRRSSPRGRTGLHWEDTTDASTGGNSGTASIVADTPTVASNLRPPPTGRDPNESVSRTSSGQDSLPSHQTLDAIFGGRSNPSSNTSPATSPDSPASTSRHRETPDIELEAVVSCTSDGLVVCLRRARPVVPASVERPAVHQPTQSSGVFAAPWATSPVFHPAQPNYQYWPMQNHGAPHPAIPGAFPMTTNGYVPPPQGPSAQAVFESIQDTAIFAWALTGINGSLADYATNPKQAAGESVPPEGLPVWEGATRAYGDGFTRRHDGQATNGSDSGYGSTGTGTGTVNGNGYSHGHEPGPTPAHHVHDRFTSRDRFGSAG